MGESPQAEQLSEGVGQSAAGSLRKPGAVREAPVGAPRPRAAVLLHLASPPREVLEALARAARAHRLLRSQGREVRFRSRGGHTSIELIDDVNGTCTRIPITQALELAERSEG